MRRNAETLAQVLVALEVTITVTVKDFLKAFKENHPKDDEEIAVAI